MSTYAPQDFGQVQRLSRDLAQAAATLGRDEARYLVDLYYEVQRYRISAKLQERTLGESAEPHAVLAFFGNEMWTIERQIHRALDNWSDEDELGLWAKSQVGIGPVIASGLLAHIDIAKAPTVGHIWSFAGLNPTVEWNKGEKRPWNADLKVLTWKAGESFVKNSTREGCYYGHIYAERKQRELQRNDAGEFAGQAAQALERKRYRSDTKAKAHYEAGKLPPAHIHARARRYAVKLFLFYQFVPVFDRVDARRDLFPPHV